MQSSAVVFDLCGLFKSQFFYTD